MFSTDRIGEYLEPEVLSEDVPPDYFDATELYESVDDVLDNHDEAVIKEDGLYVPGDSVNWSNVNEEFFQESTEKFNGYAVYRNCLEVAAGLGITFAGFRYSDSFLTGIGAALGAKGTYSLIENISHLEK
ncbi:hypothetical protein [Candidatus Nanohalobium constans]|uniref:Uncharacterized protein n=1 Tax=Candidatus Nanohalobium constans TaxID=2565781 RepID=A0A5Q0UG59_9ARCH|nr:hypothetical protein [Candidatus Nanohalobium constans]QGA80587.1 hypothetical protein LC1Nh_0698 [Candidatus Nanohalobium constans]